MEGDRNNAMLAATGTVTAKARKAADRWSFSDDQMAAAIGAAGLLRACQLIDEAIRLAANTQSVGANVLVRTAYECWLTGAWVLFGGETAMLRLERKRASSERALANANDSAAAKTFVQTQIDELDEIMSSVLPHGSAGVGFEQMAKELGPLIEVATGEAADILATYNVLYRSHSTFDAHPWKVLGGMLREEAKSIVVVESAPWIDPVQAAAFLAMYAALLGNWISDCVGRPDPEWQELLAAARDAVVPS